MTAVPKLRYLVILIWVTASPLFFSVWLVSFPKALIAVDNIERADTMNHTIPSLTFKDRYHSSLNSSHPSSSPSSSSAFQNATAKRNLIIHVGPAKTATTTLQSDLYSLTDSLEKRDNYLYMGRQSKNKWLQDLFLTCPSSIQSSPRCPKRLVRWLSAWRNNSIIFSEEYSCNALWDDTAITAVREQILPNLHHHVAVVATYRRFHEWLVSARKQRDAQLQQRQLWPQEGGTRTDAWRETQLLRLRDRKQGRPHYLHDCLQQWYDLNVSVTILNLHDEIPLTELFLCHYLPDASNVCQAYQQRPYYHEHYANARSGVDYFFDNIVFDAAEAGLFNTTQARRRKAVKQLTTYFQKELNKSIDILPMNCPSVMELDELLHESIHWEQHFAPDLYDKRGFYESFQQLVESKSFCRVDTKSLFQGLSNWSEVLRRLESLD